MKRRLLFISLGAIFLLQSCYDYSGDLPEEGQFIFSDIENYWRAIDLAELTESKEEKLEIIQTEFIDQASNLLKEYWKSINGTSPEEYLNNYEEVTLYFKSIRRSSLHAQEFEEELRDVYRRMEELYEDAVYPDVSFGIGLFRNGGRKFDTGLYIGCEIQCGSEHADLSEFNEEFWLRRDSLFSYNSSLKYILAHELIHFQQDVNGSNVLSRSMTEGIADFLGEQISGDIINRKLHQQLNPIEQQVWDDFKSELESPNISNWLYDTSGSFGGKYPKDAGYYVGYKIAEHYYVNATDKAEAFKTIIELRDAKEFLEVSKYDDKF